MEYLSADAILGADDIGYLDLEVPEWPAPHMVRLKGLSGDERDAYEQSIVTFRGSAVLPKLAGARARLVAWSIVDAEGKRVFTDRQVRELGAKSAQALDRVYEAARRLSGLTEQSVEEMEGNSDSVPSDVSTTS